MQDDDANYDNEDDQDYDGDDRDPLKREPNENNVSIMLAVYFSYN